MKVSRAKPFGWLICLVILAITAAFAAAAPHRRKYDNHSRFITEWLKTYPASLLPDWKDDAFVSALARAAIAQTQGRVAYNPDYFSIPYPGGDIPAQYGVCTDVLIRAYRAVGEDLQVAVHEDMAVAFAAYPSLWGRETPDTNIDHRRVPNLMIYFARHATTLAIAQKAADYRTGDIVAWDLGGGITHIGLVVDRRSGDGTRPLIVHNIGRGPEMQDVLFAYKIIGHFRYRPLVTKRRLELTREYAKKHTGTDSAALKGPQMIVVHATEIATLTDTLKTFAAETIAPERGYLNANGDLNVGVHFVVDRNGSIYPQLPPGMIGRHAIGFNHTALGIENVGSAGNLTSEQLDADAALIKSLVKRFNTVKYLVGHHEYVEKKRPHYRLFVERDPKYEPTQKSDPGPVFMRQLRETLTAKGLRLED